VTIHNPKQTDQVGAARVHHRALLVCIEAEGGGSIKKRFKKKVNALFILGRAQRKGKKGVCARVGAHLGKKARVVCVCGRGGTDPKGKK